MEDVLSNTHFYFCLLFVVQVYIRFPIFYKYTEEISVKIKFENSYLLFPRNSKSINFYHCPLRFDSLCQPARRKGPTLPILRRN